MDELRTVARVWYSINDVLAESGPLMSLEDAALDGPEKLRDFLRECAHGSNLELFEKIKKKVDSAVMEVPIGYLLEALIQYTPRNLPEPKNLAEAALANCALNVAEQLTSLNLFSDTAAYIASAVVKRLATRGHLQNLRLMRRNYGLDMLHFRDIHGDHYLSETLDMLLGNPNNRD